MPERRRATNPTPLPTAPGPLSPFDAHNEADRTLAVRMRARLSRALASTCSTIALTTPDTAPESLADLAANLAQECFTIRALIRTELTDRRRCSRPHDT